MSLKEINVNNILLVISPYVLSFSWWISNYWLINLKTKVKGQKKIIFTLLLLEKLLIYSPKKYNILLSSEAEQMKS